MSNVHQLPDSMERAWRVYEVTLRAHFAQAGAPADLVEHVMLVMKPMYLKASKPATFTGSGDEVIQALNTWVQQQVGYLLVQVASREVELYQAGLR